VLLDGNPRNLHHKVIVIDGRVTVFGSYNFSANADRDNDENLLIVEDPGLATAFEAEYERVRAVAANPPQRR
jgi:phosphatidylserine/phosphatidylglycerophosphate/cardiolipin synthase-like enzyme